MKSTHFWLIRHGETEWNAGRRLQGWLDVPLSETGYVQARQLAAHLRTLGSPEFHAVISSDLSRAHETARIATAHLSLPVQTDVRLRERNYGVYQGMDWAALTEGLSDRQVDLRSPDQQIEGGESLQVFADRVIGAFGALAKEYAGRNVLVFSHGGVVDIVWRKAGGHALTVKRIGTILNTSINVFETAENGEWKLGPWNQVGHLDAPSLDDVMHT
jgi:Fructose-2,6-bisphosphatase